jgi:sortase A
MTTRFALTILIAVATVCAAVVFFWTGVHALFYAPDSEVASSMPIVAATSSEPVRLIIPSLNIDANVQQVGITKAGAMGTPSNFTDVAWYKYGPAPGHLGSSVIDGHVDNGLSLAGVFKHLVDIRVGDDVYVVDKVGAKLHFVVTDIESYPYEDAPSQDIFARTDKARLNLITCEGIWVPAGKTYDHRLVVYTELSAS